MERFASVSALARGVHTRALAATACKRKPQWEVADAIGADLRIPESLASGSVARSSLLRLQMAVGTAGVRQHVAAGEGTRDPGVSDVQRQLHCCGGA
jgi:hypothetical protein